MIKCDGISWTFESADKKMELTNYEDTTYKAEVKNSDLLKEYNNPTYCNLLAEKFLLPVIRNNKPSYNHAAV